MKRQPVEHARCGHEGADGVSLDEGPSMFLEPCEMVGVIDAGGGERVSGFVRKAMERASDGCLFIVGVDLGAYRRGEAEAIAGQLDDALNGDRASSKVVEDDLMAECSDLLQGLSYSGRAEFCVCVTDNEDERELGLNGR